MIYLKSIALMLSFIFLINCGQQGPISQPDLRDYDQRIRDDENRTNVLNDSRRRYSGSTCEEEDDSNHECVDQCREIYNRRADREDCEELPIAQIEVLADLHKLLEDPDDDDLRNIDVADLEVYLNVSIAGFDRNISRYSKGEVKEVLFWMVENEDVAQLFIGEDDDFQTLETLLKELVPFDKSSMHKPFLARVDSSEKLMETAIENGNEYILDWFHDYIIQEESDCSSNENSTGCFEVFCKIGDGIDPDSSEDWRRYENFEDYLGEIVEERVNYSRWRDNQDIEELSDLEDEWVKILCDGLT